jgi:hypothetical protein
MFSLTLYTTSRPYAAPVPEQGQITAMKTTTPGTTANPRRSTLVHLTDAAELDRGARPEYTAALPARTANPRRTVLMQPPAPYRPEPYAAASR